MRVRLLGTAAGGGFPQWNCNCANCRGLRAGTLRAVPRTQSCVAVSSDEQHWFLLNASPDIRQQIHAFPALAPSPEQRRGTGIEGILLTDADLDHTLGLFLLREGEPLTIFASRQVRDSLSNGLLLDSVLNCYCGLNWREPTSSLTPLLCRDGLPSGLLSAAYPLADKPPRYRERHVAAQAGDRLGYRIVDEASGSCLLYLPGLGDFDALTDQYLQTCQALLLDGTFWSEDEMAEQGVGGKPAAQMGHLPVSGANGSLARIASLPISHKIYIHINNTNPMLNEESPEYKGVCANGVTVGWDGLEFRI
jgi:pyrroloquinoline quinone biosynthesis protein B